MKVDVLSKEETYKVKHIAVVLKVEEGGNTYKIKVIIIENYDIPNNKYYYEFEGYSWLSDTKGINPNEVEIKLENYLLDNIEDILS